LLQRSEGGGLGMGGGGGGGAISGRAAATALGFIITSSTLTILAAQKASGTSVLDRIGNSSPSQSAPAEPDSPLGSDLLPPAEGDNAPLVPRAD